MAVSAAAPRRSAADVKKERTAASEKIKRTGRQLTANEEETRRELSALQALEGEIRQRDLDAARLSQRLAALQQQRMALSDSIARTDTRLTALRQSYGRALRTARRQRRIVSDAAFIFSSESFHQARSRARWLGELNTWQSRKAQEIKSTAERLAASRVRLDSLESVLQASSDSLAAEQQLLSERKHQADAVVSSLKRQNRNLSRVLDEQKRRVEELDRELDRIIAEETRRAEEEARKRAATADNQKNTDRAESPAISSSAPAVLGASIEEAKGKLPWPVNRKAFISSDFGRHTHTTYTKVTTQNNGLDFDTEPGASARAVFDGTVTSIAVVKDYHNIVIVRHGDYLTVYAGLVDLRVRKGESVRAGQLLGTIYSDPTDDNRTRLHFELRHERSKLDPALWLQPK